MPGQSFIFLDWAGEVLSGVLKVYMGNNFNISFEKVTISKKEAEIFQLTQHGNKRNLNYHKADLNKISRQE